VWGNPRNFTKAAIAKYGKSSHCFLVYQDGRN
jgi:hypothetical protein